MEQFMKWYLMALIFVVNIAALSIPCEGRIAKVRMQASPMAMKKELLKHVPIGSEIKRAKLIMETNQFHCDFVKNSSFLEKKPGGIGSIVHEQQDFLICHKRKFTASLVFREWDIIIVHNNDRVLNIVVNVGLTGP